MPKQKLTRDRLRQIIREEKRRLDESSGDPVAWLAIRDLGLKELGYENTRGDETRRGSNEIFTSKTEPWRISQEDYSVRVTHKPTGDRAEFYSQSLLEMFLERVVL